MLVKEPEISREALVRSAVYEGYLPILNALQQEYPEKFPRVCGSYGITFTRSRWAKATGVPLQLGGTGERFELEIGIYYPAAPAPFKPDEHTYVRYYTGMGDVLYIDAIYPLLWGQGPAPARPIIEKFREDEINQALTKKYSLYPFSEELATRFNIDLWDDGSGIPSDPMKDYYDTRAVFHDHRALEGIITVDSGGVRDTRAYGGQRRVRVLHAIGGTTLKP